MISEKEEQRLKTKKEQVLQVLRNAGSKGVTNAQLSKVALRYGGALGFLYKEGYRIDKESLGDGLYNYTLISEPEFTQVHMTALDRLIEEVSVCGFVDAMKLRNLMEQNNIAVKYKANTYKAQ